MILPGYILLLASPIIAENNRPPTDQQEVVLTAVGWLVGVGCVPTLGPV